MKIVHIISRFNSGGTATWLNELVKGSCFSNDKVMLVIGSCSPSEMEGVPDETFEVIRLREMQRRLNPYLDLRALVKLIKILRRSNPDIVNTHTFKAGILGRFACSFPGNRSIKVIHTVHGHLKYGYFNPFISKSILIVERLMQRLTNGFIVSGFKLLGEIQEEGLLLDTRNKVILPGLEPQVLKLDSEVEHKMRVGWLGRLSPIKRPERVLEIANLLPNYEFFIAGSGEMEALLRARLSSNVHLVGWVSPTVFWKDKSVGLLTSDNEATPYAIIEGNMAGVPFVATNVGSVADVVIDGQNGFLAETKVKDLASKLEKLLSDENELERMGKCARDFAHSKFSLERFQKEHRDFYVNIMND